MFLFSPQDTHGHPCGRPRSSGLCGADHEGAHRHDGHRQGGVGHYTHAVHRQRPAAIGHTSCLPAVTLTVHCQRQNPCRPCSTPNKKRYSSSRSPHNPWTSPNLLSSFAGAVQLSSGIPSCQVTNRPIIDIENTLRETGNIRWRKSLDQFHTEQNSIRQKIRETPSWSRLVHWQGRSCDAIKWRGNW